MHYNDHNIVGEVSYCFIHNNFFVMFVSGTSYCDLCLTSSLPSPTLPVTATEEDDDSDEYELNDLSALDDPEPSFEPSFEPQLPPQWQSTGASVAGSYTVCVCVYIIAFLLFGPTLHVHSNDTYIFLDG